MATKGKGYTIEKYPAHATNVRIGQTWYVQIEPVMAGNVVKAMTIIDVTSKTVELVNAPPAYRHKSRYPHHSVNFVELISDGD